MKKNNILFGITGCIACYKTAYLIRELVKKDYNVKVIITDSAKRFVSPLTFKTLSRNNVYSDLFSDNVEWNPQHIALADWADLMVIAPASANTISKISYGIADNLLTSVVLGFDKKIILVPAMNTKMYYNEIFQDNLSRLKTFERFIILEPEEGDLACGVSGKGRMPDTDKIIESVERWALGVGRKTKKCIC